MANQNSRTIWIIIIAIVVIGGIIYWINNNNKPIPNEGTINKSAPMSAIPRVLNTRKSDDMSDSIVDELLSQRDESGESINGSAGYFMGSDSKSDDYGRFDGYLQKKQLNMKKTEEPYCDDTYDNRDFSYKKKRFTRRTPEDVKDLFDVDKMLPQEIENDWFDTEPLQTTKKVKSASLIHPKVHMGVNTVGSSLKNGSLDIRGDIPNPKINISPWNNSTIEPDTNIRGLCNPI
jgi:hypothetical protein